MVVVSVATLPTGEADPRMLTPSLKVMEPVVMPPNCVVMVAVSVTDWSTTAGLTDEASNAVVVAAFTVCVKGTEVLDENDELPPYDAVTECEPAVSDDTDKPACPAPSRLMVPRLLAPSKKVTLPVGIPPEPVTVAVKVTD